MTIVSKIHLRNFRNHANKSLRFDAPVTLLLGANGRGKTNILEAVYFLSLLRSFRTAQCREMIQLGQPCCQIMAEVNYAGQTHRLEVEQSAVRRQLFRDQMPIGKASDFVQDFRVVALVPEDRQLLSGAAAARRRFFDIFGATNSERYWQNLRDYKTALSNRNAALKKNAPRAVLAAFEQILSVTGVALRTARAQYAGQFANTVGNLTPLAAGFRIEYQPNLPETAAEFQELLQQETAADYKRGFTRSGLQGDDFIFYLEDKPLRNFGSMGQIRRIALYLKLAELELVKQKAAAQTPVVALVDDVTGELDAENRDWFFRKCALADQTLFTFTEKPGDPVLQKGVQICDI